jgi:uncharacterized protein (DUF2384 family)
MPEAIVTVQIGDLAKLVARAIEVFGSSERAVKWLETTNPKLGGQTPLRMYQASGAKRVEEELLAIEHGIAA